MLWRFRRRQIEIAVDYRATARSEAQYRASNRTLAERDFSDELFNAERPVSLFKFLHDLLFGRLPVSKFAFKRGCHI
jgi:hypothetical protein